MGFFPGNKFFLREDLGLLSNVGLLGLFIQYFSLQSVEDGLDPIQSGCTKRIGLAIAQKLYNEDPLYSLNVTINKITDFIGTVSRTTVLIIDSRTIILVQVWTKRVKL